VQRSCNPGEIRNMLFEVIGQANELLHGLSCPGKLPVLKDSEFFRIRPDTFTRENVTMEFDLNVHELALGSFGK
jgi:hypothetical protein